MLATIVAAISLVTGSVAAAPDAASLIEQPLTSFEDVCEETRASQIRRVRFATLDAAGNEEDHLELRTTTTAFTRVTDYIVNGEVVLTQTSGGGVEVTTAGLELLRSEDRSAKVLTAFAAALPRIYAGDVEAPHDSCGALAGKAEQLAKCEAIGLGCLSGSKFVCGVSLLLALGCKYLVNKVCDENPDSCEDHPPGWTEG